jgi:hypothetical protein
MTGVKLINLRELNSSLRVYMQVTSRTEAEVLNKTIKDVGFRAAQFTKKVTPEEIERDLRRDQIGIKLAVKQMRKTGETITRARVAQRARQLFARKKKRRGFARSGWLAALLSLGFAVRGARVSDIQSNLTALGGGKLANAGRLIGLLENRVYGRIAALGRPAAQRTMRMMENALQAAVNFVARDRRQYAEKKLTEKLQRLFSGR